MDNLVSFLKCIPNGCEDVTSGSVHVEEFNVKEEECKFRVYYLRETMEEYTKRYGAVIYGNHKNGVCRITATDDRY